MAESACPPRAPAPKPLPRRLTKRAEADEQDGQDAEGYDVKLPRVLRNKRYAKPDPALLERLVVALRNWEGPTADAASP